MPVPKNNGQLNKIQGGLNIITIRIHYALNTLNNGKYHRHSVLDCEVEERPYYDYISQYYTKTANGNQGK